MPFRTKLREEVHEGKKHKKGDQWNLRSPLASLERLLLVLRVYSHPNERADRAHADDERRGSVLGDSMGVMYHEPDLSHERESPRRGIPSW